MIKGKNINTKTPTIGVVAISAPESKWNPGVYEKGKQALIDRGCKLIEGNTVFTSYLYLAERPEKIAASLKQMFDDDRIDVIMCVGGGNCMNKIVPYIDFDFVKLHYKPFIGISDITAFLLALLSRDIVSFHGPFVLWNYGVDDTPTEYTHDNLLSILNGFSGELPAKSEWQIFQSGTASGKIIGGNISTISNIIGSAYCPVALFDDSLLFIEDIEEGYTGLDSKLTHLKLLGVFDRIKGVVFGKLPDCNPPEEAPEIKLTDFMRLVFDGYKFPIIYDCDFGHVEDNLCLPLGCRVTLNANSSNVPKIILAESGVL
jgi:muramoyltetrapeptide carboxypeptidase